MHAFVRLRGPSGQIAQLSHGDFIGRLRHAALSIDDGRVSEAHAMVSLREGAFRFLSLRGAFAVSGRPLRDVVLTEGLEITLAEGVSITVVEVCLPMDVLGIRGPGLPLQTVPAVASILDAPLRLARGWIPGAEAYLWSRGEAWTLQVAGHQQAVGPGDGLPVGDHALELVAMPLVDASGATTVRKGAIDGPLHIIARFDTVHLDRDGVRLATLAGILARLVSELVAVGGPIAWTLLAAELWPDQAEDKPLLRSRLDSNLSRLRTTLRRASIRTDLVCTDGTGSVELRTYAGDRVTDAT